MKRGQLIADKLAALIIEKMEKRAHKGDWKHLNIYDCLKYLWDEVHELKTELTKLSVDQQKELIRDEIADVAAYCAIMLDVLEKE